MQALVLPPVGQSLSWQVPVMMPVRCLSAVARREMVLLPAAVLLCKVVPLLLVKADTSSCLGARHWMAFLAV